MAPTLNLNDIRGPSLALALLAAIVLLIAGCATSAKSGNPKQPKRGTSAHAEAPVPILRYGRYRLVELVPGPAQQDLMQQIVDITVPATTSATVGDALRYLLLQTGYQLCDAQDAAADLNTLPLPAAHIHLGPLTLRDALQVLTGPAWQLQIDESTRRLCFIRADSSDKPVSLPIEESKS